MHRAPYSPPEYEPQHRQPNRRQHRGRGRAGRFFRGYFITVGVLTTIAAIILGLVQLFVEIEKIVH